jgi:hypothetical protein
MTLPNSSDWGLTELTNHVMKITSLDTGAGFALADFFNEMILSYP